MRQPFIERRSVREPVETVVQLGLRAIVESIYGPTTIPVPGLDIGRSYLGTVNDFIYGGDLVDVFPYGDGFTSIAVVDITGHGIKAAMHAGLVKHALRAYASQGFTALECVQALNHLCIENSAAEDEHDFFATLFFGIIDSLHRNMTYVSAGHDAAYLLAPFRVMSLGASGPVIGLLDDEREFTSRKISLATGNILAVVTDGFTESRNADRVFLGSEALAEAILLNPERSAQASAEAITRLAYDFAQRKNSDDIAALVVKIVSTGP